MLKPENTGYQGSAVVSIAMERPPGGVSGTGAFKIRAVQGHSQKPITKASASDTFNATMVYSNSGAGALSKVSLTGKPIVTADETPAVIYHRIYHRTTKANWKGMIKSGFIPGGGEKVSSGRARSYFSEVRVTEGSYVSVLPAERPIEICVAVAEAATAGAIFIKTASEGNLTRDAVPAQFVLSVDDTERKVNLYRRHQEIIETAKSSGVGTGLHQRVEQIEAKISSSSAASTVAASSDRPPVEKFAGKVKPPPPIKWPGYADAVRALPQVPKAEARKLLQSLPRSLQVINQHRRRPP